MDHRSIKRPRTDSSTGGGKETKPVTKPKKKQKKSKSTKSNTSDEKTKSASSRESFATAEGQTMAQVLSTFNKMEKSRFEAFRRSTFRGDAISSHVAHCLAANHERLYARLEKTRQYLGGSGLGVDSKQKELALQRCPFLVDSTSRITTITNRNWNNNHAASRRHRPKRRSLQDMVAPNQAEEVTVVVSTLAKAYAQRLVTAARRVATSDGYSTDAPILAKHVLMAHQARLRAGLDPGFFLQRPPPVAANVTAGSCAVAAAALGIVNRHELERNAALAAQEEYDKYMEEKKEEGKESTIDDALENEMEEE